LSILSRRANVFVLESSLQPACDRRFGARHHTIAQRVPVVHLAAVLAERKPRYLPFVFLSKRASVSCRSRLDTWLLELGHHALEIVRVEERYLANSSIATRSMDEAASHVVLEPWVLEPQSRSIERERHRRFINLVCAAAWGDRSAVEALLSLFPDLLFGSLQSDVFVAKPVFGLPPLRLRLSGPPTYQRMICTLGPSPPPDVNRSQKPNDSVPSCFAQPQPPRRKQSPLPKRDPHKPFPPFQGPSG